MNTNYIINSNDVMIDFDLAVNYMDDEIRGTLHNEIAPCSEQKFFNSYCEKHFEKYGEQFELDKKNPII